MTKRAKARILRSGQNEFYNSHQWAIKRLKVDGYVRGTGYVQFEITNIGLAHVKSEIYSIFRRVQMSQRVETMMAEHDKNDRELFVSLFRRLSANAIESAFSNASSRCEAFLNAFQELESGELGGFLASAHEVIKPVIGNELAKRYKLAV